jgi:hypothetical protein
MAGFFMGRKSQLRRLVTGNAGNLTRRARFKPSITETCEGVMGAEDEDNVNYSRR